MGSWSAGVWGNDTAEDLKFEYQCAFYRYDPEEAIRRLRRVCAYFRRR